MNVRIVITVFLVLHVFMLGTILVFAQQEQKKPETLEQGIENYLGNLAQTNIDQNRDQLCLANRVLGVSEVLGSALKRTFNSPLQPFNDFALSSCLRDTLWSLESEAEKELKTISDVTYALCVEDDTEIRKKLTDESIRIRNIYSNVSEALNLIRNFGARATSFTPAEYLQVYGLESIPRSLLLELLDLPSEYEENIYYSPLFQVAGIAGVEQLPDDTLHDRYKKINLDAKAQGKTYPQRIKILSTVSQEKWQRASARLKEFFSYTHKDLNAVIPSTILPEVREFREFYQLPAKARANVYFRLQVLQSVIDSLIQSLRTCGDSSIDGMVASIDASISNLTSVLQEWHDTLDDPFATKNPKSEAAKKLIAMRKNIYSKICRNLIESYKKSGTPLNQLPLLTKKAIGGEYFCIAPEDEVIYQKKKTELFTGQLSKKKLPPGIDEITLQNSEISIGDALNQKLEEESSYGSAINIQEMYSTYTAMYGKSNPAALVNMTKVLDDLIKKLQGMNTPLQNIFLAIFELQNRQNCGSCKVSSPEEFPKS